MVIKLTRDDLVAIIGNALRSQSPPGSTGIVVRFHADTLGDDIMVGAEVKWMGMREPEVNLCACTRMTPCHASCPCGFEGGLGACTYCGTVAAREQPETGNFPVLRLVPKVEDE